MRAVKRLQLEPIFIKHLTGRRTIRIYGGSTFVYGSKDSEIYCTKSGKNNDALGEYYYSTNK